MEYPRYGYRRVTKALRNRHPKDSPSNHKRVKRESGLLCKQRPKAKPYSPASQPSSIPNLLHDENIVLTAPNQVWQSDLTYITLGTGFIYLAAILDAFTRKCIGWALSQKPDQHLTLAALKMALEDYKTYLEQAQTQPQKPVHHPDQGVQYTADAYIYLLLQSHIRPSLSRRGKPTDNARAESFFKTFKHEEVYLKEYDSIKEARTSIQHFIERVYSAKRLHSALGYLSPNDFEVVYHQNQRLPSAVV